MTIDSDDMISLPSPPPPRPAARRDAIDSALRKFDGVEEAPVERNVRRRPSRAWWTNIHRRPAGALVAATLIAVISIPVVQNLVRDNSPEVAPQAEVPSQVQPAQDASICAGPDCAGQAEAQGDDAVAAAEPRSPAQPSAPPPMVAEDRRERASAASDQKAALDSPAPVLAAPAPPPPPASPPQPSEPEDAGDQNIVVTGSRIPASNMAKQGLADEVGYAAKPASRSAIVGSYGEFLSRLQAGLRANDRRATIGLIGFPLRVTWDGDTRTYRSSRDVERDFDRIFTDQVRSAVLNQRTEDLMSRDGGRLKGNGRLWFGPSCSSKPCSANGSIRIREVNP
jgi:hypothetical protein